MLDVAAGFGALARGRLLIVVHEVRGARAGRENRLERGSKRILTSVQPGAAELGSGANQHDGKKRAMETDTSNCGWLTSKYI